MYSDITSQEAWVTRQTTCLVRHAQNWSLGNLLKIKNNRCLIHGKPDLKSFFFEVTIQFKIGVYEQIVHRWVPIKPWIVGKKELH